MVFQEPKVEFVPLNLDVDISCVSKCTVGPMRAGAEVCGCSDGYEAGLTGATEDDCPGGEYLWLPDEP